MSDAGAIKRAVLVLDVTPASLAARNLALAVAAGNGARLTGLVIVDPKIVTPPEPIPIGAYSFKQRKDQVLLERARKNGAELVQEFRNEAEKANVNCDSLIIVEETFKALVGASATHDVVFTGFDAAFGSSTNEKLSPFIRDLLHDNPRPLIVTPKALRAGRRALVAYDGTISAMRALQMFCFARLGYDEVIVTSVSAVTAPAAHASCPM